jgi:transposase
MTPKLQITPRKCSIVVQYHKDGRSVRDIAETLKLPKSTVQNCVMRFKTTGSVESRPRSGRPRITDMRHDNRMKRLVLSNPSLTSNEIKENMQSPASTRTIRRRLVTEFGLRSRRPAKKPFLTPAQMKKRVEFCQMYKNWSVQKWYEVLFSDESTFCQFGSPVTRVRRLTNTRYLPQNTVGTVKHSPKIMIWGCFAGAGRGSLVFIPVGETVNAEKYLQILQGRLQRSMTLLNCNIYQQDSAPCHTAKIVKNWMKSQRINVLEWPGNSPDLNPIENLWFIMKRKVRGHAPKSMADLQYWIKRVWVQEVSPEYCSKLVSSMPRRIQAVLQSRGKMTKY